MTYQNRENGVKLGRCSHCDADLFTRQNKKRNAAFVFCTRKVCRYFKEPHPTPSEPNRGMAVA